MKASNNGNLMNTDTGTPISESWKVFYPDIRKSVRKKLKNIIDSKEFERSMGPHTQK